MKPSVSACLFAVLTAAASGPGQAEGPGQIAALLDRLEGRYQSEALRDPDLEGPQLTDHRLRVHSPALGEAVMYWQLDSGPEQQVYRQRLLVFEADPDSGQIVQRTWSLIDPERFDASKQQAELFAGLTEADLIEALPAGCDPVWQTMLEGWYGRIDPARCRIFSERHQDWRHIEAEVLLSDEGLAQAERGFDGQGRQLFGTVPGDLLKLERVAPD